MIRHQRLPPLLKRRLPCQCLCQFPARNDRDAKQCCAIIRVLSRCASLQFSEQALKQSNDVSNSPFCQAQDRYRKKSYGYLLEADWHKLPWVPPFPMDKPVNVLDLPRPLSIPPVPSSPFSLFPSSLSNSCPTFSLHPQESLQKGLQQLVVPTW